MKVLPIKKNTAPQQVFDDFVKQLSTGGYSGTQIRLALLRLGQVKSWGFIIPRQYLSSVTQPYDLEEIDYTDWPEADAEAYKSWDAVMIKNRVLQ